jgi:hypothetical protein
VSDEHDEEAAGQDERAREHEPEAAGHDDADPPLCAVAERERERRDDRHRPGGHAQAGTRRADDRAPEDELLDAGDDGEDAAEQQHPPTGRLRREHRPQSFVVLDAHRVRARGPDLVHHVEAHAERDTDAEGGEPGTQRVRRDAEGPRRDVRVPGRREQHDADQPLCLGDVGEQGPGGYGGDVPVRGRPILGPVEFGVEVESVEPFEGFRQDEVVEGPLPGTRRRVRFVPVLGQRHHRGDVRRLWPHRGGPASVR